MGRLPIVWPKIDVGPKNHLFCAHTSFGILTQRARALDLEREGSKTGYRHEPCLFAFQVGSTPRLDSMKSAILS